MVVPQTSERDRLLKLLAQKDELEARIKQHGQVLQTNRVDMQTPLVDADGFPRNDIDVHQVRHARHQIICLQNDLKALMLDIESGLHAVHSQAHQSANGEASTKMASMDLRAEAEAGAAPETATPTPASAHTRPFVRVTLVHRSSPAERAGLQVNDDIVEFGTVNASNFGGLAQIGDIVKHSVDKAIRLRVQRLAGRIEELELVPGRWTGAGLLGCVIVPSGSR